MIVIRFVLVWLSFSILSVNASDTKLTLEGFLDIEFGKLQGDIREYIEAGCPEREKSKEIVLTTDIKIGMDPNSEEDVELYQKVYRFKNKQEVKELFQLANSNGCLAND